MDELIYSLGEGKKFITPSEFEYVLSSFHLDVCEKQF